jgi:probable F420-dependent oxidoreductase
VKVRIGVSAGPGLLDPAGLCALADDLVGYGFDSLWLPEVLSAPTLDPLVGLAWAGAHNPRLKLGTTMLLPGRNPLRLAKQVAVLDALSAGRFLVTFVPGLARGPDRRAVGPAPAVRGAQMDELLPLLRRLWSGEVVSYEGAGYGFADVALSPRPVQDPFEVWLGGTAPAALARCGRLGDGWLPSMCTPEEAAAGRVVIEDAAAGAGRAISPEHFGVSIGYSEGPLDEGARAALSVLSKGRPLDDLVPTGHGELAELIGRFVAVGFSKFVVRPVRPPDDRRREIEQLAAAVLGLQT